MKKLSTLIILSVIGSNVWAFCPSGPNYWACYEQEMQTIRQQQQMNNMMQELEDIKANQRFAPRTCFRDYFGSIQCY